METKLTIEHYTFLLLKCTTKLSTIVTINHFADRLQINMYWQISMPSENEWWFMHITFGL